MKLAISKFTHKKSSPSSLSFFSVINQQKLTTKNLSNTAGFQHSQKEKVLQLIEAFFEPWKPGFDHVGGRQNTHEKQRMYIDQIKQFALLGVPAAIQFYAEIFSRRCSDPFSDQLLANAKDIAFKIKNPQLLMRVFFMRVNRLSCLDLKDGFFCLEEAAKMEGEYAVKAAYCLANLYAHEVLQLHETEAESVTHLVELNSLTIRVSNLDDAISDQRIHQNLQTLNKMGAKFASDALRVREQAPYPGEDIIHQIYAEKAEHAKVQFITYFKLAIDKSMEGAPVKIIDEDSYDDENGNEVKTIYSLNLHKLIQLKISIEEKEANFKGYDKHYQHYYDQFKTSADAGNLGAMDAIIHLERNKKLPDDKIINDMLNKLVSLPLPNHPIIANAALFLLENFVDLESVPFKSQEALRLGSITYIWASAFFAFKENNPLAAMEYFEQINANAHLYEFSETYILKRLLLDLIIKKKVPLDTNEKIDCYFQICADILMDFSNHDRFLACQFITYTLKSLFPSKKNLPDPVKKWFSIDVTNCSLEREEKYFPLFNRKDIEETMLALAFAAKQRIIINTDIFSSIKQTPTSPEDEVQKLIEAFLLPWNSDFYLPPNNDVVHEKQLEQLARLKALALSGEPAAIQFYRGLFQMNAADKSAVENINIRLGYDFLYLVYTDETHSKQHMCFSHELLAQMKEIALHNNDPYLLMCLYVLKGHVFSFLDLEDAFFCLQEAAKMEGIDAARAAYCLANYYGSEMIQESASYLSALFHYILSLIQNQKISDEQGMKNMRALEEMGSILANDFLIYVEMKFCWHEKITLADIFSELRESKQSQFTCFNDQKTFLKAQFSTYFQLAFSKSLEFGLVKAKAPFGTRGEINAAVNFYHLIAWKMKIEATYDHFPYNDIYYYYSIFHQHAKEGKIGAITGLIKIIKKIQKEPDSMLTIDPDVIRHLLIELTSMPHLKKHRSLAQAAEKLVGCYERESEEHEQARQQSVQLGSIKMASRLVIDEFEFNPNDALVYFKQITANAHLHDPNESSKEKAYVLLELEQDDTRLDTAEKIECYFEMCADILMDMTNPNRFDICEQVKNALTLLFPDEENSPENVKEWLTMDIEDTTIFRKTGYFPLFTRADVRETFEALTQAAKQTIPVVEFARSLSR